MKLSERKRRPRQQGHGRVDVERIAEAVSRPGIDPRAWITLARTEPGADARRYDPDNGWIVDAIAYGGAVHGNSLPCRVASAWPGLAGYGEFRPPADDEEIVVVLPGGDPDEDPIAIGVLANGDGGGPPETVAGRSVIPTGTTMPGGPIAAEDCEFSKSPYSRVEEHEGERHMRAQWLTLEAASPIAGVKIGSSAATHPVARGDELVTILIDLIAALNAFAFVGGTGGGPAPVVFAGASTLASDLQKITGKLAQVLAPQVVVP
jgi:hypothetical protein